MENLAVNETSVEVSVDTLINRMIEDIREGDMDAIKHIAESMYPIIVEDVEGMEGEEVVIKLNPEEVDDDTRLKHVF